eukprot:10937983-Heterocapsa_arctica.AAC.1
MLPRCFTAVAGFPDNVAGLTWRHISLNREYSLLELGPANRAVTWFWDSLERRPPGSQCLTHMSFQSLSLQHTCSKEFASPTVSKSSA